MTGPSLHRKITGTISGGRGFQAHKNSTLVTYIFLKLWASIEYHKIILPFTTSAYLTMNTTAIAGYAIRTTGFTLSVSSDLSMSLLFLSVFILPFFSAPPILTGGRGGDPGEAGRQVWQPLSFFLTLAVLWLDCGCWYLFLPLIYPYLRITEMVGPFCHIYWQKLTDNGKIGVESIFILQNNHNDNQPGYLKGQICVSHIL